MFQRFRKAGFGDRDRTRAGMVGSFRPAPVDGLEPLLVLSHVVHSAAEVGSAVTLTPPFFTFRSELANTVGKTPGVQVGA